VVNIFLSFFLNIFLSRHLSSPAYKEPKKVLAA
jgi:hypothetical protein